MKETIKKIWNHLNENKLYADDVYMFSEHAGIVEVSISWGDWKHEHLRCDYLMQQIGFKAISENVTEEDGSDCYSATHYYMLMEV